MNDRPRVPRAEVDRLKAVLHHCVRDGPSGQNRDARTDFRLHLTGLLHILSQLGRGSAQVEDEDDE